MAHLRSSEWFAGDDEVALSHRVVMASVGYELDANNTKPIIGIADSSSELNPCNLPLRDFIPEIKRGIIEAGGIPVVFPVMSLGEDLMKPSAMLYRNMLSMEVEEYLRSYPIDGVVLLANCDKSVPGSLMGAISTDLPTIMFTAGARPPALFRGKKVGTGTDLWRMWSDYRANKISKAEWKEFEGCLNCGLGSCNTMGTASSVAMMVETLGLSLPGTSTIAENDPARMATAFDSGTAIVRMVNDNIRPSNILTPAAFRNALRVLHACGGSTNAVIHLLAISGRVFGELTMDSINELAKGLSVLADVEPSGAGLIQDFHAAGGVPALISTISKDFELDEKTILGKSWREIVSGVQPKGTTIRPLSNPLYPSGAFAMVKGNLAKAGAIIKVSAASPELMKHQGPAIVFHGYADMRSRIDDPALGITKDSVLVLRDCGPVGVPGMPEWGMIPVPKKLLEEGVTDMVRISDARMSGTSFGTCILHVAPEAAIGGMLALVHDGDEIALDVLAGKLELLVDEAELATRKAAWRAPVREQERGWPALYQNHVLQADQGCDLDFLRPKTKSALKFIPPVVGRS
ncbi:MAG: dihydroxy-acid dehydratase [Actinomycetes bacterium]